MSEMKHELRSMHWAVRLLATVMIGGVLSPGMFLFLIDAFGPSGRFLILILSGIAPPISVATVLFLREHNSFPQSVVKGTLFGLVGGVIILALAVAFFIWMLSGMHIQP